MQFVRIYFFSGYANFYPGTTYNEYVRQAVVEGTVLRYSGHLHKIDWPHILNKELPLSSEYRKNVILHLSGQYATNPLLLLSKVVMDEFDAYKYAAKSDYEFKRSLKDFANKLSRYAQDFESPMEMSETSSLEYSLKKALDHDEELVIDFLSVCNVLTERYDLSNQTASQTHQHSISKRADEEAIRLELPYGPTECWQLGGTHNGALQADDGINYVMSAIDMAPSLYQKWGVPFDYLNSTGQVYSAHSGTINKHSDCALEIIHDQTGFSTYYSHLNITDIVDGKWVEQGEHIGLISLDPDESNCGCDWPSRNFLCATGPHLHFELRHNGNPATLQGRMISSILIKTGTYPHDQYCDDPNNCLTATGEDGQPCATTFTDVKTGVVTCPVIKGSNFGINKLLILNNMQDVCILQYDKYFDLILNVTV